jgi:rhodanese-related sulfurtransferase
MPVKTIEPKILKTWLDKGEACLIDVREPHEYQAARIPGAVLVSLGDLSAETLPDHRGKKLVMQCHFGKRGSTACQQLLTSDPNVEIYNLEGGLAAWVNAGYSVLEG